MFKPFNILFIVNLYARDDIFNLSNAFRFKNGLLFDLVFRVVYKFPCGSCNSFYYEDTDNPLQVRPKFTVSLCVSYRL